MANSGLEYFLAAASDWFWKTDANLRVTYVSEQFTASTGVPREQPLGRPLVDLIASDAGRKAGRALLSSLEKRRPFRDYVRRFTDPSGRVRYTRVNGIPAFGPDGGFLGYRGSATDATAENEALREAEAARRSAARAADELSATLLNIADAVVTVDAGGAIRSCNLATQRMFGYGESELVGRDVAILMAEPGRGGRSDYFRRYFQRRCGRFPEDGPREIVARRSDGSMFHAELAVGKMVINGRPVFVGTMRDMSLHKQVENELRVSRQELADAQRLARLGSWTVDLKSEEVRWSDEMYRLMGLTASAARGSGDLGLMTTHPEDREMVNRNFEAVLADPGRPASFEYRMTPADGPERIIHAELRATTDGAGEAVRVIGIALDVTESRRLAMDLARSEQSLIRAQRISRIGSWEVDLASGETQWSRGLFELLGIAPERHEPSAELFLSNVHPDDRGEMESWINETVSGVPQRRTGRYRSVGRDGSVRYFQGEVDIETGAAGQPIRVVGTIQDVTDATRLAMDLARSEQSLIRAQRVSRIGSWETDIATGEIRWSQGMFELLGLDPEKDKPAADLVFSHAHPDDAARVASWSTAILSGNWQREPLEARMMGADGTMRWVRAEASVELDDYGRPERLIGTVQDVTELRATEKRLESALEQATAASRAKSDFLANMSHELRTPLNAIIGFTELLMLGTGVQPDEARRAEYLEIVHGSGLHLLEIINDVLDMARAESDKHVLADEPFDLKDVIDWVVNLLDLKAKAQGISLSVNRNVTPPVVIGDGRLIRQALVNLVSNALKFTAASGDVRIGGGWTDTGDFAVTVSDTGIGMRAEDIPIALAPFGQIASAFSREIGGTGLGLPLAKKFIELHGGRLSIDSAPGKGTTVTLVLPGARCREAALS